MALLAPSSAIGLRKALPEWRQRHCNHKRSKGLSGNVFASLGFTTDPRIQIERAADGLLKDVAALLVYQEAFRNPPAQAFLKLLLLVRRRDDDMKVLEAYGEFFRLMAAGKHPSWQDFLLEEILKADKNPFAEAAASIGHSSGAYGGKMPASLEAAATADLESLQRLGINEVTLINWVTEIVSDTKPQWRTAASSSLSYRTVPKVEEKKPSIAGFMAFEGERVTAAENKDKVAAPEKEILTTETDFVITERKQWQKKISGLWNWSEAVPLVKQYYADNGVGRVAISQVVKWRGGKLLPDFKYLKLATARHFSIWSTQQSLVHENLLQHVSKCSARHLFLHGPSGSGKSRLLRATLSELSKSARFRVFLLPSNELIKQLVPILEEMKTNSGIRFVLVIEDLFLRAVDESFLLLKSLLDDHVEEWPQNVLLCATSIRAEAKIGDENVKLSNIFGLTLRLSILTEQQYRQCVEQVVEAQSVELDSARKEEIVSRAIEVGRQEGFSIKLAVGMSQQR